MARRLLLDQVVADIHTSQYGPVYRIHLSGALTWHDLGRLETACGQALEHAVVPLELDVSGLSSIDGTSLAYLERLIARGARVLSVAPSGGH